MNSKKKKLYIFNIIICGVTTFSTAVNLFLNKFSLLIIPFVLDLIALIVIMICFLVECKSTK